MFNYLMTGPKKCEDCARPGVPGYTLFIREQRQNISLRRRPVTPTHSALIVFLYLPYLSFRPGIKCKMFYLSHFLPPPPSLCFISGSLGISIYHRSLTCFSLLFIMRSVDTEISLAPGPGFAGGISENHSPSVTREPERYLIIVSNRRVNIKFHVLAPWSINYVNL